jgi:hypothetical protein
MDYSFDAMDDTVWEERLEEDALCDERAAVDELLAPSTGYLRRPAHDPL